MKRLFAVVAILLGPLLFALPQLAQQPEAAEFQRGAKPTPFPKIVEAIRAGRANIHRAGAIPTQVIVVPKRLSVWGNNKYGDCVTAESAFAIAAYSTFIGMDEIFVPEANVISWARSHGVLNGADLLSVIQDMERDGIKDENGVLRKAGKPSSVDYRTEGILQSAIAQGPVSIAIDANALPSGAGNKSGWSAWGSRSYPNTDHCVSLAGYGPTSELFKALGTTPPANAPATGYLLFTWNTIGVVDHKWLLNTCAEAWVRDPTVTDLQPPVPIPPVTTDVIVTVANVTGQAGTAVKFSPTAKGGTAPYIFLAEYGDGVQDMSFSHAYKADGVYTVKVTAVDAAGKVGSGACTATIGTGPPPPPPPPPPPVPGASGTISWTIDGVTTTYELFPPGTRKKLRDVLGTIAP